MTERTVTVQTEEEKTVQVCDECGLSDDNGELKTYAPVRDVDYPDKVEGDVLHLHEWCVDKVALDESQSLTYEAVYEENLPEEENVWLVFTNDNTGMFMLGLLSISFALYAPGAPDPYGTFFGMASPIALLFGVTAVVLSLIAARLVALQERDA